MSYFDSFLDSYDTVSTAFYAKAQRVIDRKPQPITYPSIQQDGVDLVVDGILWEKSHAEKMIAGKIGLDVDSVLLVDPEDITVDITEGSRAVVDSINYNTLTVDNVAFQGKVLMIPLKRDPAKI